MSNVDASDLDGDDVERSLVDTQACPGLDVLGDSQDEDVMLAAKMANCITPVGDGSDLIGSGGGGIPDASFSSGSVAAMSAAHTIVAVLATATAASIVLLSIHGVCPGSVPRLPLCVRPSVRL